MPPFFNFSYKKYVCREAKQKNKHQKSDNNDCK
nr:MAG TPA: hypothetical protein [Caudoviricetes sp.]